MSWGDVDGNGTADVAVCRDNLFRVYTRTGTTFTRLPMGDTDYACHQVELGDYDADGDPDLVIANLQGVTIFENANGALSPVFTSSTIVSSMAWGRCSPDAATRCFATAPTL